MDKIKFLANCIWRCECYVWIKSNPSCVMTRWVFTVAQKTRIQHWSPLSTSHFFRHQVDPDGAVTRPDHQGPLALRLGKAFVRGRQLFHVVILLFIIWVLDTQRSRKVDSEEVKIHTYTVYLYTHTQHRPRHKITTSDKSIFDEPSSPVVRRRGHIKLNMWNRSGRHVSFSYLWVGKASCYNETFCTVPSNIGHSMWPSLLWPPMGGRRTPLWWVQNGQKKRVSNDSNGTATKPGSDSVKMLHRREGGKCHMSNTTISPNIHSTLKGHTETEMCVSIRKENSNCFWEPQFVITTECVCVHEFVAHIHAPWRLHHYSSASPDLTLTSPTGTRVQLRLFCIQ